MTETQDKKIIVPKTSDELKNQVKWTTIAHDPRYAGGFSILGDEKYSKIGKEELEAEIAEEARVAETFPPEQQGYRTPVANTYERYVAQLRKLRKLETPRISQDIQNRPERVSGVEALRDATKYSPEAAFNLLESMQRTYSRLKRTFTDTEVKQAVETEEGFTEALNFLIDNTDDPFEERFVQLIEVLPQDKLTVILERLAEKQPATVSIYFTTISKLVPQEIQRELYLKIASNEKVGGSLLYSITKPEVQSLFTDVNTKN